LSGRKPLRRRGQAEKGWPKEARERKERKRKLLSIAQEEKSSGGRTLGALEAERGFPGSFGSESRREGSQTLGTEPLGCKATRSKRSPKGE
jgi:hypothetical protein